MTKHETDSEFLREFVARHVANCHFLGIQETKRLLGIAERLEGRCKTCKWWFVFDANTAWFPEHFRRFIQSQTGHLHRPCVNRAKLGGSATGFDSIVTPYGDATLWTGPEFRCDHHKPKSDES